MGPNMADINSIHATTPRGAHQTPGQHTSNATFTMTERDPKVSFCLPCCIQYVQIVVSRPVSSSSLCGSTLHAMPGVACWQPLLLRTLFSCTAVGSSHPDVCWHQDQLLHA